MLGSETIGHAFGQVLGRPVILNRVDRRTRLTLAGSVNSDLTREPRRGHGFCNSPDVILIQISCPGSRSEVTVRSEERRVGKECRL